MLRARSDGPSRSLSSTGSARAELGPARETAGKPLGNGRETAGQRGQGNLRLAPRFCPPSAPRFGLSAGSRGAERAAALVAFPQNRWLGHEFSRQRFRPEPPALPAAAAPGELPGPPETEAGFIFLGRAEGGGGGAAVSSSGRGASRPRRGRRCRRCPVAAPRLLFPPSRQGRATAGGGGGGAVLPAATHGGGSGPEPAPSRPKSPRRREGTGAPTCAHPAGPAHRGRGSPRPHPFNGGHASFSLAHAPFLLWPRPFAPQERGGGRGQGPPRAPHWRGAPSVRARPAPPGAGSKYGTGRRG